MAKARRRIARRGYTADIPSLQAAIRVAGHSWQAGPTSVSTLSAAEQKTRLGLVVTPAELQATARAIQAAEAMQAIRAIAAPPAVDWRNNNGNWITSIKDQQNCGSCVAFGTLATVEARQRLACKNANLTTDLSEAFLFYCGCGNCCGPGWNFAPALDFCKNTGVALETSFPYTPGDQPCKAGVTPVFKISGWSSILAVAARKDAIALRGPVICGIAVYQDFYAYQSGVYHHVSGNLVGYHAMSVVGYDDAQQCWIVKNSWGAGWGEGGFGRIGYGEIGIDTQFAFYEPHVPCYPPGPTDRCAEYVPHLKRVLQVARTNPALRACLLYYICGRGRRPLCMPTHLQVVRIVAAILRQCPRYRRPFCDVL